MIAARLFCGRGRSYNLARNCTAMAIGEGELPRSKRGYVKGKRIKRDSDRGTLVIGQVPRWRAFYV